MRGLSAYLLPTAVQMVAGVGFVLGGVWVYLALATFPVLLLADTVLPRDMSIRRITNSPMATFLLYLNIVTGFSLILLLALRIGQDTMTVAQTVGAVAGLTWLSVVPMVPASHELYHRRDKFSKWLGIVGQVAYFDISRDVSHIMSHHIDVATPADSDTAVRGESLYSFTAKALVRSTRTSIRTESTALQKQGKSAFALQHRFYKVAAMITLVLGLCYWIGGASAALLILVSMLIARAWGESFNYFQHYGLLRVPGTRIANRHSWNHMHPISRIMSWEITNHVDHHLNPYKPFYALVPDHDLIKLPSVFVCFLSALIPPVWHRFVIMPALKEWDLRMATPAEQALAREANRRAGWPDWLGEAEVPGQAVAWG